MGFVTLWIQLCAVMCRHDVCREGVLCSDFDFDYHWLFAVIVCVCGGWGGGGGGSTCSAHHWPHVVMGAVVLYYVTILMRISA